MLKLCETCGQSFRPRPYLADTARYCSNPCRHQGHSATMTGRVRVAKVPLTCPQCGAAFALWPSQIDADSGRGQYCSATCGWQARQGRPVAARRKPPGTKTCPQCQQTFSVSGTAHGDRRYCSSTCRYQAFRGEQHPRHQPSAAHACDQCGALTHYAGRRRHRAGKARFCGWSCYTTYRHAHPEENRNYRGGHFPDYGRNWAQQARAARTRDQHTCQDCGRRQGRPRLDVHHIRARRLFNGDWERANVLENLVSLCRACHTKREDQWGRTKGTTRTPIGGVPAAGAAPNA